MLKLEFLLDGFSVHIPDGYVKIENRTVIEGDLVANLRDQRWVPISEDEIGFTPNELVYDYVIREK